MKSIAQLFKALLPTDKHKRISSFQAFAYSSSLEAIKRTATPQLHQHYLLSKNNQKTIKSENFLLSLFGPSSSSASEARAASHFADRSVRVMKKNGEIIKRSMISAMVAASELALRSALGVNIQITRCLMRAGKLRESP